MEFNKDPATFLWIETEKTQPRHYNDTRPIDSKTTAQIATDQIPEHTENLRTHSITLGQDTFHELQIQEDDASDNISMQIVMEATAFTHFRVKKQDKIRQHHL